MFSQRAGMGSHSRGTHSVVLVVCCFTLVLVTSTTRSANPDTGTSPNTFTREGDLVIFDGKTDSLISELEIEIADSDHEIQTGLMHRPSMDPHRGLWFVFENEAERSFYMKNTLFPLDIVFVDSSLHVISMQHHTTPHDKTPLPSFGRAQYALEINAGLARMWGLKKGDRIDYSRL